MDKVSKVVEDFRKAMIDANQTVLDHLTTAELSYGHANGVIENKARFLDSIMSKRNIYKLIELSNQTITIVGDIAIVRHQFEAEVLINGALAHADIAVMQIWQGKQSEWKLLARQAFKVM